MFMSKNILFLPHLFDKCKTKNTEKKIKLNKYNTKNIQITK